MFFILLIASKYFGETERADLALLPTRSTQTATCLVYLGFTYYVSQISFLALSRETRPYTHYLNLFQLQRTFLSAASQRFEHGPQERIATAFAQAQRSSSSL